MLFLLKISYFSESQFSALRLGDHRQNLSQTGHFQLLRETRCTSNALPSTLAKSSWASGA